MDVRPHLTSGGTAGVGPHIDTIAAEGGEMLRERWSTWSPVTNQQFRNVRATPALPAPRLTSNVYERAGGDAYVIEVPVPGLQPDQITIEATPFDLTVSTRPEETSAESERRYVERAQTIVPMSRVFEFPDEIDADFIQATLEHGLLKILVPKASASQRKVIKVGQSGEQQKRAEASTGGVAR
jgi:HSP20 family protein